MPFEEGANLTGTLKYVYTYMQTYSHRRWRPKDPYVALTKSYPLSSEGRVSPES
jgi:hypothetical protein